MKNPIITKNNIPIYHQKSEAETLADPYERYSDVVLRQTALHLADEFWDEYPYQSILDFALSHLPQKQDLNIAEIGCGVGRLISELAIQYPQSNCYGIDYSYQMLRQASRYWLEEETIELDLSTKGFSKIHLERKALRNLELGLAKAESLPFEDASLDVLVSSFLIDRLDDPLKGILEFDRVLKEGGQLIMVSPLNFHKAENWDLFYPAEKLMNYIQSFGFQLVEMKKDWMIMEPLDKRGNGVCWKCFGFIGKKLLLPKL